MHELRRVSLTDVPWLCSQLRTFDVFFNSKYSLLPSESEMHVMLADWITNPNQYPFWVYAIEDQLVGFIAGTVHQHFYQRRLLCLTELLWWVAPEHRAGPAGPKLLYRFIEYGKLHVHWITMVLGKDTPVKFATMRRLGFELRETNFLLEV